MLKPSTAVVTADADANSAPDRPLLITLIALAFLTSAAYLLVLGMLRLANPDSISLSLGAPLLHGLELAGPYAFLLAGAIACAVGIGLLRLKNLARRAAIVIATAGIVMLIPKVSAAGDDLSLKLFVAGSMIVLRTIIVWYLWQRWTAEKFS